ncbi:MAG TPA: DUF4388 domain-containing protein [Acidimicrobiia bacterium]|nr:hypothetical protein [Acidimicrobiia bacterium]HYJ24040.1 DUF4388 domain-containing protein [Acidimicrobiia bacterium]
MALSGNLGFVPLDEVLRLLMRSDQRGSVEVRGEDIRGRVFVAKKGIALATTSEDRDLHKHLVNSGYVDDVFLRKVVSGESSFSDLHDRESVIIELLREITVESLYHLGVKGATFEVTEGAVTPYGSPRPFELEAALDDSRRRADEWASVHESIADLDATIRMNRDAGDLDEINLNREAWRLLCELGAGASVAAIAERLGTTEFWIAKVAAELTERQLLVLGEAWTEQPAPEPAQPSAIEEPAAQADSWWVEPQDEASPEIEVDTDQPVFEVTSPEAFEPAEEEGFEPIIEEARESRFGHFVTSDESEETFAGSDEAFALATDSGDQEESYSEAAPLETPVEPDAEGDTEAFLEKVFSQLEVNGKADVEEEGHGLLRRRRMGSVLKEIDEG